MVTIGKEAKNKKPVIKKPTPKYFTVKMEVLAPVKIEYRILAISAEEALKKVEQNIGSNLASSPKPNLGKSKKLNAVVLMAGFSNVVLTRRY